MIFLLQNSDGEDFIHLFQVYQSCISGIYLVWSQCIIILTHCWIPFAHVMLRIFAFIFLRYINLWFPFLPISSFGFIIKGMLVSQGELESVFSASLFLNRLQRIGITHNFYNVACDNVNGWGKLEYPKLCFTHTIQFYAVVKNYVTKDVCQKLSENSR